MPNGLLGFLALALGKQHFGCLVLQAGKLLNQRIQFVLKFSHLREADAPQSAPNLQGARVRGRLGQVNETGFDARLNGFGCFGQGEVKQDVGLRQGLFGLG